MFLSGVIDFQTKYGTPSMELTKEEDVLGIFPTFTMLQVSTGGCAFLISESIELIPADNTRCLVNSYEYVGNRGWHTEWSLLGVPQMVWVWFDILLRCLPAISPN